MLVVRSFCAFLVVHLAFACGGDDGSSLPADAAAADAIAADGATSDARADAALVDANSAAPSLPGTSFPDYTTFVDTGVNIYWRAASDDTTPDVDLEYRMTWRPVGGADTVGMDWKSPPMISVEASGRMWTRFVPASAGAYELFISVRDADLNTTDYPVLEALFGVR